MPHVLHNPAEHVIYSIPSISQGGLITKKYGGMLFGWIKARFIGLSLSSIEVCNSILGLQRATKLNRPFVEDHMGQLASTVKTIHNNWGYGWPTVLSPSEASWERNEALPSYAPHYHHKVCAACTTVEFMTSVRSFNHLPEEVTKMITFNVYLLRRQALREYMDVYTRAN